MGPLRFAFLDGIRGLAALLVLGRHTVEDWGFELHRSYLAVDVFFLLSGFVIAHAYEARLATQRLSLSDFFLLRLIRLYPAYLLSLLLAAMIAWHDLASGNHRTFNNGSELALTLALAAFYLPSTLSNKRDLFTLNFPAWSLAFELLVNAVYVLLRPWLSTRRLLLCCALFGIALALGGRYFGHLDQGYFWSLLGILTGLLRTMFGFFVGVLLYRLHPRLAGLRQSRWTAWAGLILVMAVLCSPNLGRWNLFADLLAVGVLFPLALVLAAHHEAGGRGERLLLALGATSYPVYLLHLPLARLFHELGGVQLQAYAPVGGLLFAALLMLLAYQLETRVESPLRRYLGARLLRRPAPVQPAALTGAR